MKKFVGVSPALGDIYAQGGTGLLRTPLDGGVARFKAITAVIPCNTLSAIVCTAGYTKASPSVPQPERSMSLASQLNRYVHRYEGAWVSRLGTEALCWSTRNEVRVGIKYVQRLGFARKSNDVTVVIASNLSHLVRVWMYAALYTPPQWDYKLVRARHHFSIRSHLMEPAKVVRDAYYILRVLYRLRRLKNK